MGVKSISIFLGFDFQKATAKLETKEDIYVDNWQKVTIYLD